MREMQSSQFTIKDYIDIFLRRWMLIAVFILVIPPIVYIIGSRLPKIYRSTTLILIEQQQISIDYVRPTVGARIEDRLQTFSQQIMSRSLLEKVVNVLNVYGSSKTAMESKVEMMRKNIEVQVRGTNAFTLSFNGNEPETVMKVVNMIASLFIEENLKVREQQAAGTSEFLENELKLIKGKLEAKENLLKEY